MNDDNTIVYSTTLIALFVLNEKNRAASFISNYRNLKGI